MNMPTRCASQARQTEEAKGKVPVAAPEHRMGIPAGTSLLSADAMVGIDGNLHSVHNMTCGSWLSSWKLQ
jgi:hypothetical protein